MKKTIRLRGLAEGMIGASSVHGVSAEAVVASIPALAAVRSKLTIRGNTIAGFAACDG